MTPRARSSVRAAERAHPSATATFVDTAAFSVVVIATVAVPLTFSIAVDDVFALPKTVLAAAMAGLLATLLVVRWAVAERPMPKVTWLGGALAVFVGWNLIAAWFAVDRWQALVGEPYQYQGLAVLLAYAVFLVGAWATVRTDRRRTVLLASVAVGVVVVAGYAVIQRAGLDPIWPSLPDDRVFSTIGQANALAAYLVVSLTLVVPLAVGRRWAWRLAAAGVLVLSLAALAFTLSRGGFLGIGASALTFAAAAWLAGHRPMPTRRLVGASLVAVAIMAIGLTVPAVRGVAERVANRALLTADLSEGSNRMHLDQWAVGAAIVADHPLLGTGQETYVLMFDAYRDDVLAPDRAALLSHFRPESPHNVYLATAAGAGVPALLAYLAVIGAAVACAIRAAASAAADTNTRIFVAAGLAAIAGHLVTDMFLTAETSGSVVFWVALGAAAAAGVRSEGEPSRPSATGSPRAAGSSIIRSVDAAPNAPEA